MLNKKPNTAIRVLLQMVSALLCLLLMIGLLVTVFLMDLRTVISADGIHAIVTALSMDASHAEENRLSDPSEYHVSLLAETTSAEISQDSLTDSNFIAEYIYEVLNTYSDKNIPLNQVVEFVEASTILDYTSDKIASYVQDAIRGEEKTYISADEIVTLLEENAALIEEMFAIEVTEEMTELLREQAQQIINEQDLNGSIRRGIHSVLEQPVGMENVTINDLLVDVGNLSSVKTVLFAVGLCVVMIALIMLANYYKLPKGLTWVSVPFLAAGLLLSVVVFGMQEGGFIWRILIRQMQEAASLIGNMAKVFAPTHYAVAIMGILMLIGSILWRILPKISAVKNDPSLNLVENQPE